MSTPLEEVRSKTQEVRSKTQEVRSKTQEVRSKKQEVRSKKQEVRSKTQEVRSKKQEVRSKKQEVRSKKTKSTKKHASLKIHFIFYKTGFPDPPDLVRGQASQGMTVSYEGQTGRNGERSATAGPELDSGCMQ